MARARGGRHPLSRTKKKKENLSLLAPRLPEALNSSAGADSFVGTVTRCRLARIILSESAAVVALLPMAYMRAIVGLNLIWMVSAFQYVPSIVEWNVMSLRKDLACRPWYQTKSSVLKINVASPHRNMILAVRMQLFDTSSFGGFFGQKKPQKMDFAAGKSQREENLWKSTVDPSSGKEYFYNTVTLETRWDRPDTMDRALEPIQMGRATATATKSDVQQVDPAQLDPLYFRFNDKAMTHPIVSCSEYTTAGHLLIRPPPFDAILPPCVSGSARPFCSSNLPSSDPARRPTGGQGQDQSGRLAHRYP